MTVHYGAFFEAVDTTHSISNATCQISVLARLVKPFWNLRQKAWAQRRTRALWQHVQAQVISPFITIVGKILAV